MVVGSVKFLWVHLGRTIQDTETGPGRWSCWESALSYGYIYPTPTPLVLAARQTSAPQEEIIFGNFVSFQEVDLLSKTH